MSDREIVYKWANGNQFVPVFVFGLAIGFSISKLQKAIADNCLSDLIPLPVKYGNKQFYVNVDDIANSNNQDWFKKLELSKPLRSVNEQKAICENTFASSSSEAPKSKGEVTASKVAEFIPQYLAKQISLQRIGDEVGLTGERVRQILSWHFGIDGSRRHKKMTPETKEEIRRQKKNKKELRMYGCLASELEKLYGPSWLSSYKKYLYTRANAIYSLHAEWQLTYKDWLEFTSNLDADLKKRRYCVVRINNSDSFNLKNIRAINYSALFKEIRAKEIALNSTDKK